MRAVFTRGRSREFDRNSGAWRLFEPYRDWMCSPSSRLEKELEVNGNLHGVPLDPLFTNLHGDPRWQPLLEKAGVSADQLAAIEFNITLPE